MKREDLGDLATFIAVADERSFTKAAAKLGTSQSNLSHTIRRLEQRLGIRLLVRTTRNVAPTEAGERLIETLRPTLHELDNQIATLNQLGGRTAGSIRITTSEHAARAILWPAIQKLVAAYPDIKVELNVESGFTDIVEHRFDAGVRLGEQVAKDMIAVRIGPPVSMAVVASPAYLSAHGTPLTPQDLTSHACINLRLSQSGGIYAGEFEKEGREVRVRVDGQLVFNQGPLILDAALAGLGIAYVMADRATEYLADGRLVRVLEDWCEPFAGYHLYYPSRRQMSPVLSLLVDALRHREI